MRVDITDPLTPGYEAYLDGKKLDDCVLADEETGIARIYERHWRTGELIDDESDPTGSRTLELRGKVEVRPVLTVPGPGDMDVPPEEAESSAGADTQDYYNLVGSYPYTFTMPLERTANRRYFTESVLRPTWEHQRVQEILGWLRIELPPIKMLPVRIRITYSETKVLDADGDF